jgi:hypothetical protein
MGDFIQRPAMRALEGLGHSITIGANRARIHPPTDASTTARAARERAHRPASAGSALAFMPSSGMRSRGECAFRTTSTLRRQLQNEFLVVLRHRCDNILQSRRLSARKITASAAQMAICSQSRKKILSGAFRRGRDVCGTSSGLLRSPALCFPLLGMKGFAPCRFGLCWRRKRLGLRTSRP